MTTEMVRNIQLFILGVLALFWAVFVLFRVSKIASNTDKQLKYLNAIYNELKKLNAGT